MEAIKPKLKNFFKGVLFVFSFLSSILFFFFNFIWE